MRIILSVSTEPALLYTRGLVLERTGAVVKSATPEIALDLASSCEFSVIVICHSLPDDVAQQICLLTRTCHPAGKILLIESPRVLTPPRIDPDLRFVLEEGPDSLVKAVLHLMESEAMTDDQRNAAAKQDAGQSGRILPFRSPAETKRQTRNTPADAIRSGIRNEPSPQSKSSNRQL